MPPIVAAPEQPTTNTKPSPPTNEKPAATMTPTNKPNQGNFLVHLSIYLAFMGTCVAVIYQVSQMLALDGEADEACREVRFSWLLPKFMGGRDSPKDAIVDLRKCANVLYSDHLYELGLLYIATYISLKSLAIPGGMILCILAGSMMSLPKAQLLVTFCEVCGGSACFVISKLIGGTLMEKTSPVLLNKFRQQIEENRDNLFYYVLFLRITPMIPNNFVNSASSVVGVPFWIFVLTSAIGVQLATFLSLSTGAILKNFGEENFELNSTDALYNVGILFVVQFVALIPVFLKKRGYLGKSKFE